MASHRFRISALAIIAVICIVTWFVVDVYPERFLHVGASASDHLSKPSKSAPMKASAIAGPPRHATANSSQWKQQPLPPTMTPVTEVITQLDQRAESGDARAACRIAEDLQNCRQQRDSLNLAANIAGPNVSFSGPMKPEKLVAQLIENNEKHAAMCEGVDDRLLARAYHYQALAADHDSNAFQRWLAVAPTMDRMDFLSHLNDWRDYQHRAEAYFDSLMSQHRLADLPLLLRIYAPFDPQLMYRPPYRRDDPATFLALYQLARQNNLTIWPPLDSVARSMLATASPQLLAQVNARVLTLDPDWSGPASTEDPMDVMASPEKKSLCD
jgi:hypothetical protein